ncbi:AMP-binding protein [Opitutus sp. ER46]|uniref:AMP-binding protein n=1 Tax=Opitutus sp. ER46 TaxID=2161864 RepID=UPI000D2FB76C|nr:AMP-binding protein [Opitutus sp. ER46]PTX91250.1 2-succinylbenzoate-CoA ligase [Opitutus sp. ER46]
MERAALNALLRATGCAERHGSFVFLRDPTWSPAERTAAEALMAEAEARTAREDEGWLCVRTGGSGGGMKLARHDEQTLGAAVRGFCDHFDLEQVNTVGVLPPWHVSGLMARVRCGMTDGEYLPWEWKALEAGEFPRPVAAGPWVISLVPTQLQRLLLSESATAWLRRFNLVLLGGGPVWPALADAAARAGVPMAQSYGMTETAAMVVAQRPKEFLAGDRSVGTVMPHASVRIDGDGHVVLGGESLFHGYFPSWRREAEFVTQDLGRLDEQGRLHLLGRSDAVIITGGKKVQPSIVEAALRASGQFSDVAVIGLPDPEWGERVVACYPAADAAPDLARAAQELAPYQRPKDFVALADWPRNAQGKVNRAALAAAATQQMRGGET